MTSQRHQYQHANNQNLFFKHRHYEPSSSDQVRVSSSDSLMSSFHASREGISPNCAASCDLLSRQQHPQRLSMVIQSQLKGRKMRKKHCGACWVLLSIVLLLFLWIQLLFFNVLFQESQSHSDEDVSKRTDYDNNNNSSSKRSHSWMRSSLVPFVWFPVYDKQMAPHDEDSTLSVLQHMPQSDNLSVTTLVFLNQRPLNWSEPILSYQIPPLFESPSVIVIVMSARANIHRRNTIRATWKKGHDANVFFVISAPCWVHDDYRNIINPLDCQGPRGHDEAFEQQQIQEQLALEEESHQYRDMIYVADRPESYRSLPYKLKFAYAWVVEHFPTSLSSVQWIAKADDDMFVRVDRLELLLEDLVVEEDGGCPHYWDMGNHNNNNNSKRAVCSVSRSSPAMVGNIQFGAEVLRYGKWKELDSFNSTHYPPWPRGSCGHVVNRPLFEYIAAKKDTLVEYQGEDTSLGIWFSKYRPSVTTKSSRAGIPRTKRFFHEPDHFRVDDNCTSSQSGRQSVMLGHDLSEQEIRRCYHNGIDESGAVEEHQQAVLSLRDHAKQLVLENRCGISHATSDASGYIPWKEVMLSPRVFMKSSDADNSTQVGDGGTRLLVLVQSQPSHFFFRQSIRNTWAAASTTNVIFLLTSMSHQHDEKGLISCQLRYEQSLYRDMIKAALPKSSPSNSGGPKKVLQPAYQSLLSLSKDAPFDWYMTTTDRMYVRVERLEQHLVAFTSRERSDTTRPAAIFLGISSRKETTTSIAQQSQGTPLKRESIMVRTLRRKQARGQSPARLVQCSSAMRLPDGSCIYVMSHTAASFFARASDDDWLQMVETKGKIRHVNNNELDLMINEEMMMTTSKFLFRNISGFFQKDVKCSLGKEQQQPVNDAVVLEFASLPVSRHMRTCFEHDRLMLSKPDFWTRWWSVSSLLRLMGQVMLGALLFYFSFHWIFFILFCCNNFCSQP